MSQFKLCGSDELLELLRDTFHANPIRIPETRFVPLVAIAKRNKNEKFIGRIEQLMTDSTAYPYEIGTSEMANVSAKKTTTVNFDLGFRIMDGFLEGMGVSGASIRSEFEKVKEVSFSFKNVKRYYVDLGQLGNFLSNKKLNRSNPANAQFFDAENETVCIVVDSTIVSNNFTMNVEKSVGEDFALDLDAIKNTLGNVNAGLKVGSSSKREISFEGENQLAFAFSGTTFQVDQDGTISFEPIESKGKFFAASHRGGIGKTITNPNRVLLYEDFGLIEFDKA